MKRLIVMLLLAVSSCRSAPGPTVQPESDIPSVASWNRPVNFDEIRATYGANEDFYSLCEENRPLNHLFDYANAADWPDVLVLSGQWLRSCPVDIDAHYLRAIALAESGYGAESEAHFRWFRGLMGSVLGSGDGETPETAFVVISIAEEYSVMRALRYNYQSQLLLEGGIDALTAVDAYGKAITVYFSPEAHWRRLAEKLPNPE